ncbi:MAG: AbrB/MazE/SpoVT family DNA-binding domain-containing protein [Halobacterium sp.]
MESRKVQQVGGGTYTVSLPREWAEESGVEAGAPVYLYTHRDGSLVVRRRERDASDLASVTVTVEESTPEAAERQLRAAYAAGFKRIGMEPADRFTTEQRRAVAAAARALTGVEVTETGPDGITVEGLLDAADVSVRQTVLQLRFVATSMQAAAVDALVADDADAARVRDRSDEVDRAFALLTRHFNRSLSDLEEVDKLGVDRQQLARYYETARRLDGVASHALDIAAAADRLDDDLPRALADDVDSLAADARDAVEDATDAVVNGGDPRPVLDAERRVVDECRDRERALQDDHPRLAYPVGRALDRVAATTAAAGDVAAVALQSRL